MTDEPLKRKDDPHILVLREASGSLLWDDREGRIVKDLDEACVTNGLLMQAYRFPSAGAALAHKARMQCHTCSRELEVLSLAKVIAMEVE